MRWSEAELLATLGLERYRQTMGRTPPLDPASAKNMSEDHLLQRVRSLALQQGWLFHHVRDSRGCDPGFPDVCCVKPGHPLLIAELKSSRGKLTRDQMQWMEFLRRATGVEQHLWRPSDFPTIVDILTRSTP